jgi:hypothetical protein
MRFHLGLLLFTLLTACIDTTDPVAETESELSTSDWYYTTPMGIGPFGAQIATLNGTTYMVHTGDLYSNDKNMYWRKRIGFYQWSAPVLIPGQKTSDDVSLAAFNGYLYMVHIGETDNRAVWFSRFDPVTETWLENTKLALTTDTGAPALAAFDNKLWIVGAREDFYGQLQLWATTMSAGGYVAPAVNIGRRRTTSTRVSLAAYANKLYMAYGDGGSDAIVTITHDVGGTPGTWSAPSFVKAGPSGSAIHGDEPKLAVAGGYLHLVHRRAGGVQTFWTTWNRCTWAPEQQIDQVGSIRPMSLADGGQGLVLIRWDYNITYRMQETQYFAPPPPTGLPQCGGTVGSFGTLGT